MICCYWRDITGFFKYLKNPESEVTSEYIRRAGGRGCPESKLYNFGTWKAG
jgi:hypothetical protein